MSEVLAQLEKKGGGNVALYSTEQSIQHGTGSYSGTKTSTSPITGFLVATIIAEDGGSRRDNYIEVNGERICTAQWNSGSGRASTLVPIKQGDITTVTYNVVRTNGYATCGYSWTLNYIN